MSRDAMRAIQPLDPWKHGPAVLKLYADNFGAEAEVGASTATTMLAPTQLLDLDDTVGFVWQEAGEVLGTVTCHRHPRRSDVWVISGLVTDARYRRRGIGNALLQTAVRHVASDGAKNVALHVDARNIAAVALYTRAGFARAGGMVHLDLELGARSAVVPASVRQVSLSDGSAVWDVVERSVGRSPVARIVCPYLVFEEWQRQVDRRQVAYVDMEVPATVVVFAQTDMLPSRHRKISLTTLCDAKLPAGAFASFVSGVLRTLTLGREDIVSCQAQAQSLNALLGLARTGFKQKMCVLDMCKTL